MIESISLYLSMESDKLYRKASMHMVAHGVICLPLNINKAKALSTALTKGPSDFAKPLFTDLILICPVCALG